MQIEDYTGQVIKGYELVEFVARGGFGAVYRAIQPQVNREVAIKIILPEYANRPDFIRRFEAEAQMVARLEHPHIIPLYDYWRDADGAYLVMRWLRGGSLRDVLKKGVWDAYAASHLLDQIAQALYVAHINGIIHRDIKPDNILFGEHNNSYLADFGIAKDNRVSDSSDSDLLLGSPAYLSPEQIRSDSVSPQTDIYSLAIVMFEILVGEHPFDARDPARLLFMHLNDTLPTIMERRPDLPDSIDLVLQRATAKDADDRHKSVIDFAIAFKDALDDGVSAPPPDLAVTNIDPLATLRDQTMRDIATPMLANPYKGLRAFQEADVNDFYGREKLVGQLLDRMEELDEYHRFLALVGPSGSGKSSVIKAGLIPALRNGLLENSDHWFYVEMFPGINPFEELEAALLRIAINPPDDMLAQLMVDQRGLLKIVDQLLPPDNETELLLVIDQFEEVFTQFEDEALRDLFLNSLCVAMSSPRSRLRIIITLRADFYDRPLYFPDFAEMFRQRTEVILPMSRDELQRSIASPVERVGVTMEQGLVPTILRDIAEQPGALPLLQYALTELFDRRNGRVLTVKAYQESGGVLGALARRADELYRHLTAPQQAAAKQLFLRMVSLGEGSEDTRRRVRQTELMTILDEDVLNPVINVYGQYRLLTFDRDPSTRESTLEVAHEALIQRWDLLQEWIDENRENLRVQRRLTNATIDWITINRESSFLARGSRLAQFELWVEQSELALSDDEQAYLDASVHEHQRIEEEERERQHQELELQRQAAQRLRYLVGVFIVATVMAIILSVFALNQRAEAEVARATSDANSIIAEQQAEIAQENAVVARSLELVAGARDIQVDNPNLALLLAMESNNTVSPPEPAQSILAEIGYAPGPSQRIFGHTDEVNAVAYSPDGSQVVTASADRALIFWDVLTGAQVDRWLVHESPITSVAFSPDGTKLATSSSKAELLVWELASGSVILDVADVRGQVRDAIWFPDGQRIASVSSNRLIVIWDVNLGKELMILEGHTDNINSLAISPDGLHLYSASEDHTILEWDLNTGTAMRRFRGHEASVTDIILTSDGSRMVTSSLDQTVITWDLVGGTILGRLQGHDGGVLTVDLNSDDTRLLTGSADRTIKLWNFETNQLLNTLYGHDDRIRSIAFSPDGWQAVSTSSDMSIIIWDIVLGNILDIYTPTASSLWSVDVHSADSRALMTTGYPENAVLEYDFVTDKLLKSLVGHEGTVSSVKYNADGTQAISTSFDKTIILWDMINAKPLTTFVGHSETVWDAMFNADETQILSGSSDETMILWDVATGEIIRQFAGAHSQGIHTVYLTRDNRLAISGSGDGLIVVWDVETGNRIQTIMGHAGSIRHVTMNADETQILSTSTDGAIMLWNLESGSHVATLRGHTSTVQRAIFIFDDQFVLSGSADKTLIMWDLSTQKPVRVFQGHEDRIWDFALTTDGLNILSATRTGMLILWRIDTLDELREWILDNRFLYDLTCEERSQYRIEPLCEVDGTE
jgi:WD40 repeat protein/serine/threonine protein kinase